MKPSLLFFVSEDWFFCSHFIDRALAARDAGWDVTVMTNVNDHGHIIEASGLRLLPLKFDRRRIGLLGEMRTLLDVWKVYRAKPYDLIHQIALKPLLYGTLAALITRRRAIVNAPVGMGYVFTSADAKARLLRLPLRLALRFLLNPRGSAVIFENRDDLETLVRSGDVRRDAAVLIRGAGVDLDRFRATPEPDGTPVVILTGRMLWDKGIGEYVEAAQRLRDRGIAVRFQLVGGSDPLNHAAIAEEQLRRWHDDGVIEWLGRRQDVPQLLAASHIVCLPSYREGLPKSLLEALAAGRPIVTTDVPGCREVVQHGRNGLLVPARDAGALAEALATLLADRERRRAMGTEGRRMAEEEFSTERVCAETLAVYDKLHRRAPAADPPDD